MATMNYPAKNRVRGLGYRFFDHAARVMDNAEPRHGIYLPGEENLEASYLEARGMNPWGIEGKKTIWKRLQQREIDVFHGTVNAYVHEHMALDRPRLDYAFFDGQSPLYAITKDLLSLFHVFPGKRGGVLTATMFNQCDGYKLQNESVATSMIGSILPEDLLEEAIPDLLGQWERYVRENGDSREAVEAAQNQVARDAGFLWNLFVGIGAVTSPQTGYGRINMEVYQELSSRSVFMNKRIRQAQADRVDLDILLDIHDPELDALFNQVGVTVWPVAVERLVYHTHKGNRMTAWFVFFLRSHTVQRWGDVARRLWSLYYRSPLQFIDKQGNIHVYHALDRRDYE